MSCGGLLCKNEILNKSVAYEDIANSDVQDKRAQTIVPFSPGGNLHSYVPFYFWGLTPMLLVNKPNQKSIIFFVAYTDKIAESDLPFAFTDRHAVVKYAQFYNEMHELKNLDWDAIKLLYWKNTDEDPDRKEKKQAEFLIYAKLPWELIHGIAVFDDEIKIRVENIIKNQQYKPIIKVKKEWYY